MHRFFVRTSVSSLVVVSLMFAGCSRPGEPPDIDRMRPLLRLAVSLATERFLGPNPKVAPLIVDLTTTLLTLLDTGTFTTPASMRALIAVKLDQMKLTPDVRLLINVLLDVVSEELRVAMSRVDIPDSTAIVMIEDVLGWMREVAMRYMVLPLPPTPATGRIGS